MLMLLMIVVMLMLLMIVMMLMLLMIVVMLMLLVIVMMLGFVLAVLTQSLLYEILGTMRLAQSTLNDFAGKFIPGSCDNRRFLVVLTKQMHALLQLLLLDGIGTAQNNRIRMLHLVQEEFAEVLHIALRLLRIYDSDHAIQLDRLLAVYIEHCSSYIRQLAYARRLNQNAVRMIFADNLLKCLAEIADQRAADAAGIHLGNLDAGIFQKPAVNSDLTELILDQDNLLSGKHLAEKMLDECCLSCPEETGNNTNLCHCCYLLSFLHITSWR